MSPVGQANRSVNKNARMEMEGNRVPAFASSDQLDRF
jgi:hypothetical protein